MVNKVTGLRRVINAFRYSCQGLNAAWRGEAAFRQEVILLIIAIVIALIVPVSGIERLLLIGSVWLVLVVELLNSAIEAVVDRIGEDYHPLSGRAKDIGSAAVLLSLLLALLVWLTVLWPLS
jgi:diacylglycerol kinase (ATP)